MLLRNKKPLYWAYAFVRILQVVVLILFVLFLFFPIHELISNDNSFPLLLKEAFKAGVGVGDFIFCENCNDEGVFLAELNNSMILWMIFRGSVIFLVYLAILHRIVTILQSIKTKNTFYEENIKNFQFLTRYGGLLIIVGSFNFFSHQGQTSFQLSIPFGPIMFTMACWLLAEIFREGKELSEDNQSIV